MTEEKLKETAFAILNSAIDAVKPAALFQNNIQLKNNILKVDDYSYDLRDYDRIYVIGMGKAAAAMGFSLENILGDKISGGVIITKYDHRFPCQHITIYEGAHPVPDQNTIRGTEKMLAFLETTGKNDLVFCLISGGGSALLEKLPPPISLADLQTTTRLLLNCGATIDEFNIIRKHLSRVKGGQLARAIAPAHCIGLIISDVIGNRLDTIASGPLSPDDSTFADAWTILEKYHLTPSLPQSVSDYLQQGYTGAVPDTPDSSDAIFHKIKTFILGSNRVMLSTAKRAAEGQDFQTLILTSQLAGEAREAAKVIKAIIAEMLETNTSLASPFCLLFGGETTVTIRGTGKGGRNQEFVLAALQALKKIDQPFLLLSCGSDGTDGPTDAAGAWISNKTWQQINSKNLSPDKFLDNNDAYHFFEAIDQLIITGPTGTNVMDIGIILCLTHCEF